MPRGCPRIIESKSKVRNSRNKPVVAKVSSSSSTPGISSDVAELKDMVKALLLDKKSQAPAPVKAVEESCVTCGGAHSYRNSPATNGNVYRDNIQEFVSKPQSFGHQKAINGFDMPLPVAVCSGLVNPLAPRKASKFYRCKEFRSASPELSILLLLLQNLNSSAETVSMSPDSSSN
ncbi:hypothetical protein Tco_0649576 [Tanacetum coccineum]